MTFVAVEIADVATQLWHPLKIGFTGPRSILKPTKSKFVLLYSVVSLLCTDRHHHRLRLSQHIHIFKWCLESINAWC